MKIGFIGLGKLGLPIAKAIAQRGHEVFGYDIAPVDFPIEKSIDEVLAKSEIVFVAVQTPHKPEHEGVTRITSTADFDYSHLFSVLNHIDSSAKHPILVSVISTVSPGTSFDLTNPFVEYCYNPFFIAMGTVVEDFLNPEFVLIGRQNHVQKLKNFYTTIHGKPIIEMSIPSAQIVKMAYNTFIGMKIVFANNLMELCTIFGGNVDDVTGAIKRATDRIISPRYLDAGMGDGGGCHPRDNIVLSHIAQKHHMSTDLSGFMMKAREAQAEWIVDRCLSYEMPVCVLGLEFKPESDITTGSPAVLCLNILKEKGATLVGGGIAVYLIGCKHKKFLDYKFPVGSVVIDPHRYIHSQWGVKLIRLGECL